MQVLWQINTFRRSSSYHFGSLSLSLSLDDLMSLFLFRFLDKELSSLRLLLGWKTAHVSLQQPCAYIAPQQIRNSLYLPTCLASTAAVYSLLKLNSVMATSSRIMLKSLARSNSSRLISRDTYSD